MAGTQRWASVFGWLLIASLAACSPPSSPRGTASSPAGDSPIPTALKRITIAMGGVPPGFNLALNSGATNTPGLSDVIELVNPSLSNVNGDGVRVPFLAATVPTT